jgi:exonuclease SbcC
MIGFMEKLGLVRFATKENPYIITTEDGLKVAVTGAHFHLDIDYPENIDDYIVEEKLGDYHIHIVHGMLSDKSMGGVIRHTLIDQIKHTKADLTIAGHNHIGFPLTEVDGKYFVNPGAIPRLSNDVKEIARKPKVLLIDITRENGLKLKEIYLQDVQDGEIVLDRAKIEAKKDANEQIEEYKKAIRDAKVEKKADITEIINEGLLLGCSQRRSSGWRY